MKRILCSIIAIFLCMHLPGCSPAPEVQVVATTAPIYEFTLRLCSGTDIRVGRLITENVSCLHDYALQTSQMRQIENAELVILSGAGLEDFMSDVLSDSRIVDTSDSIELLCPDAEHEHAHDSHTHHHDQDPHIWLSPALAQKMVQNIYIGLTDTYPEYTERFNTNLQKLLTELSELEAYGQKELSALSERHIITFHDGFAYLAEAFDLEILHAIDEASGSEASAAELIEICNLIDSYQLAAIFTEQNGSVSAAEIISAETDAKIYQLNMAMDGTGYFTAMYQNINTLKEALG